MKDNGSPNNLEHFSADALLGHALGNLPGGDLSKTNLSGGDSPASRRGEVLKHLANCWACRDLSDNFARLIEVLAHDRMEAELEI